MRETKLITWRHLAPGQEINGYKSGNTRHFCKGFIASTNAATVVFHRWDKNGTLESVPAEDTMFEVSMSETEISTKYRAAAKECILAMQNRLAEYEIGYHEMWNSWLYGTPYEIAAECQNEKIKIVGHCTEIMPKIAMFSGDTLDVGVCAEYEDGERFWCHFRSSDIADLIRLYGDELGIGEEAKSNAK